VVIDLLFVLIILAMLILDVTIYMCIVMGCDVTTQSASFSNK